ncbi:MAG TPA: EF-hand domain-containing protein [Gemmataceae bacterium]|nr:EF-hand domain-containing protein [Gemmataceae bacterium]
MRIPRWLPLLTVLIGLFTCSVVSLLCLRADDAPTIEGDKLEVVYLGEGRPVFLRFQISLHGKPARQVWQERIAELFKFLDRDNHQKLSEAETANVPAPLSLLQLIQGDFQPPRGMMPDPKRGPETAISLVGGKVTSQGLGGFFRVSGLEPFLSYSRQTADRSKEETDILFGLLDRNQDGKLTKEEVDAAAQTLAKLDADDNEILSPDELFGPRPVTMQPNRMQNQLETPGAASGLLILDAEDAPSRLMYALLSHYDKDSDQKLSKQELILPAGLFEKLDTDKDGFLDSDELAHLYEKRVVEVDFNVELDRSLLRGKVLTDPNDKALSMPELALVADGTTRLTVGKDLLTLQARGDLPDSLAGFREGLLKKFQSIQGKKGEAVPLKQLAQGSPVALGGADRNNDGKVSEDELKGYLDVLFNLLTSCPIFTFTDSGQGLMAALDPHADSQLRLYDVRSAWSRMESWNRDKDGAISREEIPRQCHLLLSQGVAGDGNGAFVRASVLAAAASKTGTPLHGPVWFYKMDRNGDGVVSLREFLGSREHFDAIDTDHDGFITLMEAKTADARFREAQKKP